jgi:hypothetical protein
MKEWRNPLKSVFGRRSTSAARRNAGHGPARTSATATARLAPFTERTSAERIGSHSSSRMDTGRASPATRVTTNGASTPRTLSTEATSTTRETQSSADYSRAMGSSTGRTASMGMNSRQKIPISVPIPANACVSSARTSAQAGAGRRSPQQSSMRRLRKHTAAEDTHGLSMRAGRAKTAPTGTAGHVKPSGFVNIEHASRLLRRRKSAGAPG